MASVPRAPLLWLAAALVVAGCGATTPPPPTPRIAGAGERPSANASVEPGRPTPPLPDLVDIRAAGAIPIEATYSVDRATLAAGKAWIAGMGDGIGILDAGGRLTGSVPVDDACGGLDTGFDAVWTATCEPGGLVRIDARTGGADTASLGRPIADREGSVGAGEGGVWVVVGEASDELLSMDPYTLEVNARYALPTGGAGVRAAFGGIWVTRPRFDELLRVDPASGQVATIHVAGGPRFLAAGRDAIWVLGERTGEVTRVDPATNAVIATVAIGGPVDGGDIAIGGDNVWVRGGPALLTRIDPAANTVTARYGPAQAGDGLAAGSDAVWITSKDEAMIWCLPIR